jgi:hypothetical protein
LRRDINEIRIVDGCGADPPKPFQRQVRAVSQDLSDDFSMKIFLLEPILPVESLELSEQAHFTSPLQI